MSPGKVSNIEWDKFYNIVDGKNRSADKFHNGVNPINREKNWDVPIATQQDVDDAVAAGNKAFESWSQTPIETRKELLSQYVELWKANQEDMTELLVKETGKPRQWAGFEVGSIPLFFQHHLALDLPEETVEDDEKVIVTKYKPLGVVGAICPWNFPLVLSLGKVIPALLTGCTIIIKPSPFTPYSALKAVELAQQIFPPGVVQALGGDDRLGPMFTAHPGIAKISFTGSTATGKKIMAACASTLKRVTLELGGNDASIVLPDVNIAKVAPELVLGAFQNSGQVCVATKRIYIHESIYQETLKAMSDFAKNLKIGNPDDAGVQLGPVQNEMQYERVKGFFAEAKKNNFNIVAGSADVPTSKGFFFEPTIIDNPPNGSRIIEEEPFGPIVPTQPYSDIDEVISRANRTNSGLGACVWGTDVKKAQAVAERLQAGSVFVNSFEKPTPQAIFGGWKESGIGGEWGTTGLLAYCNAHAIHTYKQK
ncbi:Aldehyde dehydrogenase [Elsinoe australis]|uniref:aldehyde dehydrogenase (NAD(+)) n=1 Tax=Elsinoe australis TaxID=40998 RepID=A0A2P8A015_9PEZI|nr:Aldehyde dehydrogenase [Elsinoe australis]